MFSAALSLQEKKGWGKWDGVFCKFLLLSESSELSSFICNVQEKRAGLDNSSKIWF